MSKCFKQPHYKGKALENQWMGIIFQSHDLICGCDNPIQHIKEIQKRDKWLHTKDAATNTDHSDNGDGEDFPYRRRRFTKTFRRRNKRYRTVRRKPFFKKYKKLKKLTLKQ